MPKKIIAFFVLLMFSLIVVSCDRNVSHGLPEEELAALDAGVKNPPQELVKKFHDLLERLSSKCPSQSPEEIKKTIIQGQRILEKLGRGKKMLMAIAVLMDKTIPSGTTADKCDKINLSLE